MTLGQKLKYLRDNNSRTQAETATILNIEQSTLANYEKDKRMPKIDILVKLARLYKTTTDYLLEDISTNDILGYEGGDEAAMTFQHKLCNQIDFHSTKISDLAKALQLTESTIVNWLTNEDESYTNYYKQLSEYFKVQLRYWTSPGAISPGIEPDMEEYLLILLYRNYKETGRLDDIYGTLEHYFPGVLFADDITEKKALNSFRKLTEDNQDIIIGDMKKYIREQSYEESYESPIAQDEPLAEAK